MPSESSYSIEADLQRLITDEIEETLALEFKSADGLARDDKAKAEITKDVAAMANSAGGTIIYGIGVHREEASKHLPEKITPIDRTQFSPEWLDQIISGVQPRIAAKIDVVPLSTSPEHVAYVVRVPQG